MNAAGGIRDTLVTLETEGGTPRHHRETISGYGLVIEGSQRGFPERQEP
jgi:hypothetical protein